MTDPTLTCDATRPIQYTLFVSRHASCFTVLKAAEDLLLAEHPFGQDTIFTVQALPYHAALARDPWSAWAKGDYDRMIAACALYAGIAIAVAVDGHLHGTWTRTS